MIHTYLEFSLTLLVAHFNKTKAQVQVLPGDIPPQVSARLVRRKISYNMFALKAVSSTRGQSGFSGKRSRGGQAFRAAGGGNTPKPQSQGTKASSRPLPKTKSSKKRKFDKPK